MPRRTNGSEKNGHLCRHRRVGILEVVANGERRNLYTSNATGFRIYGRGGNDVIHIDVVESITLPAFWFGGPGADDVSGGAGDDVIDGGDGNDRLSRGARRPLR